MKKIFILIASAIVSLGATAQLTALEAFRSAPETVMPLLTRSARLDMIDYYNAGQETSTINALEGKSRITSINPLMVSCDMTDASRMDVCVLPAGSDSIIAIIKTVRTPTPDSSIQFYNTSWDKLTEGRIFNPPILSDWLTENADRDEVEILIPFILADYTFDPATLTLTLNNHTADFMGADTYSMISDMLKPQLTYQWKGKKFELKR